jgi:hypothetical protein
MVTDRVRSWLRCGWLNDRAKDNDQHACDRLLPALILADLHVDAVGATPGYMSASRSP